MLMISIIYNFMPQEKRDLTLTVSSWLSGSPGREEIVGVWDGHRRGTLACRCMHLRIRCTHISDGPITLLVDCRRRWRRVSRSIARAEKMELQMELFPFLSTH